MPLLPCTECGNQISDQAVACPQCGAPVEVPAVPAPATLRSAPPPTTAAPAPSVQRVEVQGHETPATDVQPSATPQKAGPGLLSVASGLDLPATGTVPVEMKAMAGVAALGLLLLAAYAFFRVGAITAGLLLVANVSLLLRRPRFTLRFRLALDGAMSGLVSLGTWRRAPWKVLVTSGAASLAALVLATTAWCLAVQQDQYDASYNAVIFSKCEAILSDDAWTTTDELNTQLVRLRDQVVARPGSAVMVDDLSRRLEQKHDVLLVKLADDLLTQGRYDDVAKVLGAVPKGSGSQAQAASITARMNDAIADKSYRAAVYLFGIGDYYSAKREFALHPQFKDAADYLVRLEPFLREIDYKAALAYFKAKQYAAALPLFVSLGSYKDAESYRRRAQPIVDKAERHQAEQQARYDRKQAAEDARQERHQADEEARDENTAKRLRYRCTRKGAAAAADCYDGCSEGSIDEYLDGKGSDWTCAKRCWENDYRPASSECGYDPGPWIN